jgi:5-methylcytosine-specific restriction endonuclease McrA
MNYKKIYENLIAKGITRGDVPDREKHHIIPKCMGGSDLIDNLVNLTPEEHYLAHLLLVKIYPGNGALIKAAKMMTVGRTTNKIYGWVRRKFRREMSLSQKGQSNSQFGTRWIHNKELKQSKKVPKNELLPHEWNEGRVLSWDKLNEFTACKECGKTKNDAKMFCNKSCATSHSNRMRNGGKFQKLLEDLIRDYQSGNSIYRCLLNQGMDGTGKNFNKLKQELKNRGLA